MGEQVSGACFMNHKPADDWDLMGIAPHDATEIRLLFADGSSIVAHWAHGGGEDQPPFGPGWFRQRSDDPRSGYIEVTETPICWKPL